MAAIWGDADKGAHATFTKFVRDSMPGCTLTLTMFGSLLSRAPICTRMKPATSVWGPAVSCEFPVDGSIGAGAIPKRERFSMKNRPVSSIRSR